MSTRVTVTYLPKCDFHGGQHDAEYDFRTYSGQWGNGCEQAWIDYRLHDTLGTGKGQKLVVEPLDDQGNLIGNKYRRL